MDAISASLAGITAATRRFDRASTDLVRSFSDASAPSVETSIVDMLSSEFQFKASLATLRAADEMLGTLLDIRV